MIINYKKLLVNLEYKTNCIILYDDMSKYRDYYTLAPYYTRVYFIIISLVDPPISLG